MDSSTLNPSLHKEIEIATQQIDLTEERLSNPSLQKDFKILKNKIQEIKNLALMTVMIEGIEEKDRATSHALKSLNIIKKEEWPFKFFELCRFQIFLQEKIRLACKNYDSHLTEEDRQDFTKQKKQLLESIALLEAEITKENVYENVTSLISTYTSRIKEIKKKIKIQIDKISLFHAKQKILDRIETIQSIYPELSFVPQKQQIDDIIDNFIIQFNTLNTQKEMRHLIKKAYDQMEEIDMSIEKKNVQREIQESYNQFTQTVNCVKEKQGIRTSSEASYATDSVESSNTIIEDISIQTSLVGIDARSKLEIIKEGTQRTLTLLFKSIYEKFGQYQLEKLIEQLPFSSRLSLADGSDNEASTELKSTLNEIVKQAKEELKSKEQVSVVSPLMNQVKIKATIDNLLIETCKAVYTSYATQCLKKTYKFILLRKSFEKSSEEELEELEKKAINLIEKMTAELNLFLEDASTHQNSSSDCHCHNANFDIVIDQIISKYIIKLRKN